jgi:hypothetical protein
MARSLSHHTHFIWHGRPAVTSALRSHLRGHGPASFASISAQTVGVLEIIEANVFTMVVSGVFFLVIVAVCCAYNPFPIMARPAALYAPATTPAFEPVVPVETELSTITVVPSVAVESPIVAPALEAPEEVDLTIEEDEMEMEEIVIEKGGAEVQDAGEATVEVDDGADKAEETIPSKEEAASGVQKFFQSFFNLTARKAADATIATSSKAPPAPPAVVSLFSRSILLLILP